MPGRPSARAIAARRGVPRAHTNPRALVLSGAAVVGVTFGLARYAYGLFLPDIRADYGLDSGALGLIAAAATASYLAATALAPWLSSRYGARVAVAAGGLLAVAGMTLVGLSRSVGTLAAGVVVAGASAGLAFPPYSAAVAAQVETPRRDRAIAVISAGTGLGVLVASPFALVGGGSWRLAWLAFAAIALGVTVWATRALGSGGPPSGRRTAERATPRLPSGSPRMLAAAVLVGVGSAVYWTFGVDLVARAGTLPRSAGSALLAGVGIAGLAGALAGDLVGRLGVRRALSIAVVALAASLALLPDVASSWPGVVLSAGLFGAAYIFVAGVLTVWSARLYRTAPAHGLATMLLALFAGQIAGPVLAGQIARVADLGTAFRLGALAVLGALALAPTSRPALHGKGRNDSCTDRSFCI